MNMSANPTHDWFLQEWFATAGLRQADLVNKLGYQKGTAFKLWHGVQPYRRDNVDDVVGLLHIAPYELFMHPEEAMRIRRMRSVLAEAARSGEPEAAIDVTSPSVRRTGTLG
ncbi:hypothetical protein KOAAANKH_00121 [Brevundimonas sp. NIBR10]|nr:hypothetical protein KOAAANKH_00121 [Brevundimonas sp. NIBR10]